MTDHPMPFTGPMVKALLAGRKTQTRRLIKLPDWADSLRHATLHGWRFEGKGHSLRFFPEYEPGDRIWVQETPSTPAWTLSTHDNAMIELWNDRTSADKMPRWASRLTLTITRVRIERLQGISEEDAEAEGVDRSPHGNRDQWIDYPAGSSAAGWLHARESFRSLWNSIYVKKPGATWDDNPWVAALTFKVEQRNIDEVAA